MSLASPAARRGALALALLLVWPALGQARTVAIGTVQGAGGQSPMLGREVVVEGVVTADWRQDLGGWVLQGAGDGDDARPDALFVQGPDAATLAVGDRVRVRGEVIEAPAGGPATRTTLKATRVERLAAGQPLPVRVLTAAPADWLALEGERVRIDAPLTLAGTDRLAQYGELTVAFAGSLWQPSEVAVPGTAQYREVERDNARRRLVLDDASSRRNPAAVAYLPADAMLRTGSTLTGVEGIVDRRYDGGWRLQLDRPLAAPPLQRPTAPPQVPGRVRVAAFNLENFFNGDGGGGGFPTLRGARTPAELQAQLAKLVATIRPLQADVAALMELENDGYGAGSAIATLVDALNEGQGKAGDWRYVDAGSGPGNNPIRVGLIYRATRVKPVGRPAVLEGGPFVDHSRVPLAQAFASRGGGQPFVVVANHFKSKGCSEATGGDADQRDGQGCWNATRVDTARRLDDWLRSDPTGGGQRIVMLGDFNAYAQEAPLRALYAKGWRDAFAVAGVAEPYSYVYNGLRGRLDHALLSPALAPALRGAAEWHINADEQDALGYRGRNVPGPWRSSDHDPLLLGFDP